MRAALALALIVAAARPAIAADADAAPRADDAGAPEKMGPEARALYDRGLALYQTRDYANAIKVFEQGFALEPRREFLFADAQARRLAGDCRGAVPLYQRFLELSPPAVQASATHLALSRCAQQMASEKPAAPIATPTVVTPPPPPAPPPPWTHDRPGAALLGAGVVALGVGAAFLGASFAALPAADTATYAGYGDARATAESRHTVAVAAFVAGGALVAAGIARYVWVRHDRRARATLTVVPGGLALGGSF